MKMKMKTSLVLMVVFGLFPMLTAHSQQHVPQAVIDAANVIFPGIDTENISQSPIVGIYQVPVRANVVYMSADGLYAMEGDLIDIKQGVNLTESERNKALARMIDSIGEDSMIVFAPEQVKSTITVFTDITCQYCTKLHEEVPQLNENGVKVRYLAYPRAGIPSSTADDMASVWCSDDPRQALTDAKAKRPVTSKTCPNPVSAHYELGVEIGVRGTPTIILEDGSRIGGYLHYSKLIESAQQAHDAVAQANAQY